MIRIMILPRIAILVLAAANFAAHAQTYPSRAIRMIVPAAAGGSIDVLARGAAQQLAELLGQPIVVDNRAGASAIIGSGAVADAAPDGYTIGLLPDPVFTIYPHVYKKLPFSAESFAPISMGATTAMALFVHPSVPANTLQELVALAKAKPDALSFGTPGTGSPMHLAGELIAQMAGIRLLHVPYKGGAPATTDAIAGQIPMLIAGLAP